jgi:hypothetical protein
MEILKGDTLVLKSGHKIIVYLVTKEYVTTSTYNLFSFKSLYTKRIFAIGEDGKLFFGNGYPISENAVKGRSLSLLIEKKWEIQEEGKLTESGR